MHVTDVLKRSLGLAFGAYFLHDFTNQTEIMHQKPVQDPFFKNVPFVILYQLTKFQCYIIFPSQDIKQNVLLSSYLDK